MNAVILVAGVARRLAPLTDSTHKALLPVGGRPVLTRMLDALNAVGRASGHAGGRPLRRSGSPQAGERVGRMAVRYVDNPEYTRGSVLSLYTARQALREPTLIMDADVLFPRDFLRRLLEAAGPERACSWTAASATPARR